MRGSTHLPQAVVLLAITTLAGTTVVSDPQTSNPPTDISESNRLVYRGRVIDGVTGEPLSGVFVGAPGVLMPETGFVTQAQWAALHRLPASPEIGSPAIDCIRDKCKVRALTRTASDGQFALSVPPDFWLKDRSQANVPCRGTFVVSIKNERSDPDIKQSMDFEIMDEQDIGKHFMFVLSDKMYKLLFP